MISLWVIPYTRDKRYIQWDWYGTLFIFSLIIAESERKCQDSPRSLRPRTTSSFRCQGTIYHGGRRQEHADLEELLFITEGYSYDRPWIIPLREKMIGSILFIYLISLSYMHFHITKTAYRMIITHNLHMHTPFLWFALKNTFDTYEVITIKIVMILSQFTEVGYPILSEQAISEMTVLISWMVYDIPPDTILMSTVGVVVNFFLVADLLQQG